MRRWIVPFFLAFLLLTQRSPAQTDSQQPPSTPGSKRESSTSSIPLFSTLKPSEDQPTLLPPGADPQNRLFSPLVKHLALDQKQFWTEPFHLRWPDAKVLAPFAAFTGALMAGDDWISRQVPGKTSQINRSKNISDYATYSLIGAAGGSYLWGHLTHNGHLRETGFLATEAALNSTAVTYLFKTMTQRPRPLEGNGNGTFFQGGTSFPSEHSAIAWSVASVVAHEYPGTLTKIAAYGLASTVTLTRVTGKQHFASDVVVGSALGWYFARQVYRAHHDPELGGTGWGELVESKTDSPRNPASMGSPYVPLDSWVYPAMERLVAQGYIQSGHLGMRPWTRMECARLLAEAGERMQDDSSEDGSKPQRIYADLEREFNEENSRLGGAANIGASLDSVYVRFTGISGAPLRDGFHFGQTIINDYGRPYGEGFNNVTGFTSHAVAGPFSLYVRGEYQHSPFVPGVSDQVGQVIQTVDGLPAAPLGTPLSAVNKMNLVEGYVGVQLGNWQLTFGKQGLWWGPDQSGPMLFSTNAEPISMLRISRVTPVTLPGVFGRLGPMRVEYFLGRISGQHWVFSSNSGFTGSWANALSDQPFIVGQKVSFKPTPNLELGISSTSLLAGPGVPFTVHTLFRGMFSTGNGNPGTGSDPGDRRGAFDFAYRIPKLRNWLTFYGDAFTDDQVNPWFAWDKTALTAGLYLPRVPKIPKLDFRVEGVYTDLPGGPATVHQPGFFYSNDRFKSGYTNDGNLIGSWIGREGQGAQAWTTYWFSPKNKLQLHFRHQKVSRQFIPDGGSLTDIGVSTDIWVRSKFGVSAWVQHERWLFPVIQPNASRNVTAAVQILFEPRKLFQHSGANGPGNQP
jgi:capsule assembly protein Wzi/PAP2 superfamily protein